MSPLNRQLLLFLSMAYLISWIIWLPLYLPAFGIQGLPVLPYHHFLGGLGPMIAAFISSAVFEHEKGLSGLLKSLLAWKPLLYLSIALFSPFLLVLLASGICFFKDGQWPDLSGMGHSPEFPDWSVLTFFLYNLFFFGFGEESGWRGFVLPRLQGRYNALNSAILLTVFWAIWHWPLFFYRQGYTSMGASAVFGWVASLLTGSVLLGWLFNSTRGSILICAVFHAAIDIAFTSAYPDDSIISYTGLLITFWGIATIIIFKHRNLSKLSRTTNLTT